MKPKYLLPLVAAATLAVVGCTKAQAPTEPPAQNQPPAANTEPVQPAVQTVKAINPNYPLAKAGDAGWDYHKELKADLDGDGAQETLTVIAKIAWDAQHNDWAYDDGHNWQVYVTEPDGTVTYLFDDWVQLGKLDVFVVEQNQIVIHQRTGAGLSLYATRYKQGDSSLTPVFRGAQTGFLQFVDPAKHD